MVLVRLVALWWEKDRKHLDIHQLFSPGIFVVRVFFETLKLLTGFFLKKPCGVLCLHCYDNSNVYISSYWQCVLDCQMVLNPSISKTSKIRVFNHSTLVALSRLYVWGSANKSGVVSVKKRPASRTEAFQFTSVCMRFAHFPWTNGIKILVVQQLR